MSPLIQLHRWRWPTSMNWKRSYSTKLNRCSNAIERCLPCVILALMRLCSLFAKVDNTRLARLSERREIFRVSIHECVVPSWSGIRSRSITIDLLDSCSAQPTGHSRWELHGSTWMCRNTWLDRHRWMSRDSSKVSSRSRTCRTRELWSGIGYQWLCQRCRFSIL